MTPTKKGGSGGGRRGKLAPAAYAVLALILMVAVGGGIVTAVTGPYDEPSDQEPASRSATPDPGPTGETDGPQPFSDRVPPRRIRVPAMQLDERLVPLGLSENEKDVELPPERRVGWFSRSAAPGQPGPVVLVGYITRPDGGPGAFADLGNLSRGHRVALDREDGRTAIYRVRRVERYASGMFPREKVYPSSEDPVLRIVTSGGKVSPEEPEGNTVVYARLLRTR